MYSNKQAFALVTVLMILVLLLILSTGIIISSSIGIQRTTVYQDHSISYLNALSGTNMVLSFFDGLPNAPDWQASNGGDLGDIRAHLPSVLQSDYSLVFQNQSGNMTQGMFRVVSAERIAGERGLPRQDFEVVVAGYTMDGGSPDNETFVRTRIRLAPEFEYAYFNHRFESQADWVGSYGGFADVPTVRFYGRVHSNSGINLRNPKGDGVQYGLNAEDPIFRDWGGTRNSTILSIAERPNRALDFLGGRLEDWDTDPAFYPFTFGDTTNPNYDWYGIAGFIDEDSGLDLNFGGQGAIEYDADYVPFPDVNTNIRSLMWNGDPGSTVPANPALDSPDGQDP